MTVIPAQLEASISNPTATIHQILVLTPVHPQTGTPTRKHKLPCQTNTVKAQLPFSPSTSFFMSCSMHSRAESSSKQHSPPSFTGGGKNFKGWQRKWKGTLFIRPWRETHRGSASALNQPWLLDMLNHRVAERQSRTDWRQAARVRDGDRNRGRYLELKGCDIKRHSRQIKTGNATFMQVTSYIPFNLFLTTEESLWNTDRKEKPWSVSLKLWPSNWSATLGNFTARHRALSRNRRSFKTCKRNKKQYCERCCHTAVRQWCSLRMFDD